MNNRWYTLSFSAILFLVLGLYAGPWYQDTTEIAFQPSTANQVILAIQSGQLKPDAKGIVILPPALAKVSKNGKAYVTKNGPGATIILIPDFVAGGWFSYSSNYQGNLYSNIPLPASCVIIGPILTIPFYTRFGNWSAGQTDFEPDTIVKVSPKWYHVSTDNW